jgi:VIT1/CCC1 family predicted Fe2+/Mn2+ transporter
MPSVRRQASAVRNFVFGVEDSLVSTVGLLSGIAVAQEGRRSIILTGVVLVFVEAFSMAVGSLLSENAEKEYSQRKDAPLGASVRDAGIMFASYFAAGFIPIAPYAFWEQTLAFPLSVGVSLLALFLLGALGAAAFLKGGALRHGFRMVAIGGAAIALGVAVGWIVGSFA